MEFRPSPPATPVSGDADTQESVDPHEPDGNPEPGGQEPDGVVRETTIADLAHGVVVVTRIDRSGVHLGFIVALGVLALVCLLSAITRASALPLIALAPLPVAAYAVWRIRTAADDRKLVGHVTLFTAGVAVSLWSMSLVARMLT